MHVVSSDAMNIQSALGASSIPFSVITKYSFVSGMDGESITVASLVPALAFLI
jgi:hypothetical protein